MRAAFFRNLLSNTKALVLAVSTVGVISLAIPLKATDINSLAVSSSCFASGSSITVTFNALINQWQSGSYSIAISTDATPSTGDTWYSTDMNGSCPGTGFATGGGGSGNPQVLPQSRNQTISVANGNYYLIVIVKSNTYMGSCTGEAYASVPITVGACGSPTFTPTISPTTAPSPVQSPTITRTVTPAPPCVVAYDNNAASFGSTQVGSGTWSNAWNRGTANNAVMFVVLTVSTAWSGTVTYNGVAMTLLSSVVNTNNTLVYYLPNPASGSNNIVVDAVPDDWDSVAMTAFSYSGIDTSDPFLSNNYGTGAGSGGTPYSQDVAITAVRSDSVILGIHTIYDSTASTGHSIAGGTHRYFDSRNLYNSRNIGFGDMLSTGGAMTVSQSFSGGSGTKNKIAFAIELNTCGPAPTRTPTQTASPSASPTPTVTPSSTPLSCESSPQCTNNWVIYGNGYAIPNGLRLTDATNFQSTTAWSDYKIDLNTSFSVEYDMRFSANSVVNDGGADGIVFIMHNDARGLSAIGDNGQGLGYADTIAGGNPGIIPSLAIEFDTFRNVGSAGDENWNDPDFDHISIHLNGNGNESSAPVAAVCADAACANIEDGNLHRVRIDWNAVTGTLQVYFNGNLRMTYSDDVVTNVFGGTSCVFWGFGSATGGSNNVHEVIEVECLTPTPTPTPAGTNTFSPTRTRTPSATPAFTLTRTPTWTPFYTLTRTLTRTPTRTLTRTSTVTSTLTRTLTRTPTFTPTRTPSFTVTRTFTPGPTATPAFPLVKSADVASVTIGSTITYSIAWTNDSGSTTTIHIWDSVDAALTYAGCDNSCNFSGGLVTWSLAGQTAGSSGTVRFWAIVSGYPYWPMDATHYAAVVRRRADLYFPMELWP